MHRLDSELARMIKATRASDGPGPEDRARIGKKLATQLGDTALLAAIAAAPTTLAAGKAVAATGAAGALMGGAKIAGVVILVAGVVAAVPQSRHAVMRVLGARSATEVRVERPTPNHPSPSAPAERPAPVPALVPTPAEPPAPVPVSAPAPVAKSKARSALTAPRPVNSEPPVAALQREAKILQEAQQALRDGRPAVALDKLAEHDRAFRPGALHGEAQAARVMALCALGRRAEAAQAARAFLQDNPRSPLAAQVRGSCAVESEP